MKSKFPGIILGLTINALVAIIARAAVIPPSFINSVVALGIEQPVQEAGPPRVKWITEGTGFFYGYLVQNDPDASKRQYEVYLVTARHVVVDHNREKLGDLRVRVNPTDSTSSGAEFDLSDQSAAPTQSWFFHPDPQIDVAAVRVNLVLLRERGFQSDFFTNDQATANREKLRNLGTAAGDGVFVLGFPMNLAGEQRNYVIVRQGVIARINEMLDSASTTYMIDSLVFPGNSGGPVVLKPEIVSMPGTKAQNTAYLIGIVRGYRPYIDIAISTQTTRPRVTFEENSGLAEVLPIDYIDEAIKVWRATVAPPQIAPPQQ